MSVLRKLEEKIQSLFEGSFGRAFKSPVQPVELAHKLVKEMGEHKVVSVSRVYAPNEYSIFLSPADREQFESYEEHLKGDLADYLMESAAREGYELLSRPMVLIRTDEDLEVGEFGIATRMVSAPSDGAADAAIAAAGAELSRTAVYRPAAPREGTMSVSAEEARELGLARERVTLTGPAGEYELSKRSTLIGRGQQADIRLRDLNVSRRHAEIRRRGNDFIIVDLDSTNGIEINGEQVASTVLSDGDVVTLGETRMKFERRSC